MSVSTHGIELRTSRRWLADAVELVSSMRFAISLLTLIAIASAIGTVLTQGAPLPDYVNQFGPFWFQVFARFSLYQMYSSWWFLLIMTFLVISTSLCLYRNAPRMVADAKSWRDTVREQSLRNFHHHVEWRASATPEAVASLLKKRITGAGYRVKQVQKDQAVLLTGKQGAANKWGYIFAHAAIVIICLGALLDSTLPITLQKVLFGKTPYTGSGVIAKIPEQHRLSIHNPTFRGNTFIPEGLSSSTTLLPQDSGVLVQDLPFSIELKKFSIDYYSTGMPRLFISDVIVHDRDSGAAFPASIKVNHPLVYRGVAVYQSSFEDGGSKLHLSGFPMQGDASEPVKLEGIVNDSTPLSGRPGNGVADAAPDYTVEWTGFRAFNVENMAEPGKDVRAVTANQSLSSQLAEDLGKHMGSGAKQDLDKSLHNVGPSLQYKLRDKNGQAIEFNTYMRPVRIGEDYVFLTGMRTLPDAPFEYLRIPADDNDSLVEWMRLRAALQNPDVRSRAARRYAEHALQERTGASDLRMQLEQSALRGLTLFAGDGAAGGFQSLSAFLARVPADQQQKAADIFMRILSGSLWDVWQIARLDAGLPEMKADEPHSRFLILATNALSDAFLFKAPLYLQLNSFDQVQASVFQITRSPGKKIVYVGCLFLVLGIVCMLYLRERRVWVWLKASADGGTLAIMAMSAQRRTLDFEKEFVQMTQRLNQIATEPPVG